MRSRVFWMVGVAAFLCVPGPLLARSAEIPSAFSASDVVVDGIPDDWAGTLVPLPGLPLSMGVRNDGSFLYVCVTASDEAAKKQILATGLSIFLDASGKETAGFGVRYPLGHLGADPRQKPFSDDPRRMKELELVAAGSDLAILGREEADLGVMRVADAQPIEAALGEANGTLVIELKVPLAFSVDTPLAVETQPGRTISIGLDTSEPKIKKSRGSRPDGSEGAGGSGGRGGHGYGGGGRGGMGTRSHGERDVAKSYGKPLKAWVTVPLSADPAAPKR